jgi:hypothetical protein
MIVKLVVGDWSHDGHEKTESHVFEISTDNLNRDYALGVDILEIEHGTTIRNSLSILCSDYVDDTLPVELRNKLRKSGINFEEMGDAAVLGKWCWDKEKGVSGYIETEDGTMSVDTFVNLYFQIARLGNPLLTWKPLDGETINIGGYGLFY